MENETQRGRYSIVGGNAGLVFKARRHTCQIQNGDTVIERAGDPFAILREITTNTMAAGSSGIFNGGAVGYISYDAVRHIELVPDSNPEEPILPEMCFMFPTEIILCDHHQHTVSVVTYRGAERLEEIVAELNCREHNDTNACPSQGRVSIAADMDEAQYGRIVNRAKEYIYRGDIFQVVLSHRCKAPINADPLSVYENLRVINPSCYLYYLSMDGLSILGSSPETLIKLQGREVTSVPIAGTRPRGKNAEEDRRLMTELLKDEKERAEHVMLVDLARNDIGRVCAYGSVRVTDLMKVELYSKVMHITSRVTGLLAPERDAFDAFKAAFPAGTVSGAPKVRAMEVIDELEAARRGVYAGAIGYFGFDGSMDFCIAIRTIIIHKQIAYLQSGAGIVADSIPEKEYAETLHKMKALKIAVEIPS
jgi:anthranilate synthase component 1